MDKKEYLRRMQDANWAPGRDAIRETFAKLYNGAGIYLRAAQLPGLRSELDGFGVYSSPNGYTHIVTHGLSQIRPHRDACNYNLSGWGFELTIKWPDADPDLPRAFHILDRLAEGIDVRKDGWSLLFPPEHKLEDAPAELLGEAGGALVVVADTEVPTIDTLHGKLQFRQIVSISPEDSALLAQYPSLIMQVLFNLEKRDAHLPFRQPAIRRCAGE